MAHALYSTPWFNTAILKRIRPGYVLSAILHLGRELIIRDDVGRVGIGGFRRAA